MKGRVGLDQRSDLPSWPTTSVPSEASSRYCRLRRHLAARRL